MNLMMNHMNHGMFTHFFFGILGNWMAAASVKAEEIQSPKG